MKETKEPLAKFHARIDRDGRVTIPRHVRAVFHINKDDYVKTTIRRIYVDFDQKTIFILGEDSGIIMRVGRGGMITIPQKIREELQLDPGDLVEVIIENVFKLKTGYEREFRYIRETK